MDPATRASAAHAFAALVAARGVEPPDGVLHADEPDGRYEPEDTPIATASSRRFDTPSLE